MLDLSKIDIRTEFNTVFRNPRTYLEIGSV